MSTKDTCRERRRSVAVRHSRERATQSTPFRFVATKETKREREIHATERLRTRLSFSSDFASPPKSFSPIDEIRTRERKKERTIRYILLSFFRALLIRRRLYRPHELRVYLSSPRVYRSGSFIGISFVFITGQNDAFKFH